MSWYQTRVPTKYREHKTTVFLLLGATCCIALFSYLNGRVESILDFAALAGTISGISAAITAWQAETSANRKINRYTTAIVALKNHVLWWDGLTSVDQNSQQNINTLVMARLSLPFSNRDCTTAAARLSCIHCRLCH